MKKIRFIGLCSHGIEFKDTIIGCVTNCVKCNNKGKIAGYWKEREKAEREKRFEN